MLYQDIFIKNSKVYLGEKYEVVVYYGRKDILRSGNRLPRKTPT